MYESLKALDLIMNTKLMQQPLQTFEIFLLFKYKQI